MKELRTQLCKLIIKLTLRCNGKTTIENRSGYEGKEMYSGNILVMFRENINSINRHIVI